MRLFSNNDTTKLNTCTCRRCSIIIILLFSTFEFDYYPSVYNNIELEIHTNNKMAVNYSCRTKSYNKIRYLYMSVSCPTLLMILQNPDFLKDIFGETTFQ